ncbi:MAG: TetR family transcriptional regulator [Rhodospirillaceae bacterium]|nr:TetR family transcriptional regulator [Rhodospirillaceae bacterium]
MAAPRTGTRERILDAAEYLFASKGFDGTSTREIVARSGDTIGSVNYHFGSKNSLLDEVIRRRWNEVTEARRQAYAAARTASPNGKPSLEAVVESIVVPYMERAMGRDKGWRSYSLLQGHLLYTPHFYKQFMMNKSEPTAREFLGWLQEALPGAGIKDIGYAYQFMIGIMAESCAEVPVDRIKRITDGAASSQDFEAVSTRLVRFIAAGIKELCLAEAPSQPSVSARKSKPQQQPPPGL